MASYCLSDILSLWISVGVFVSGSLLLSVSSFICISGRFFSLCGVAGRWGGERGDIYKVSHFYSHVIMGEDFHTVTLLVLRPPRCSHYEGHSLSPSGTREWLQVLVLHVQQSIQQAFVLERFVPLVLTNKITRGTKGYMPQFIDRSQKYFHSCKSWRAKIKTQPKKTKRKIHDDLSQREVKKTSSELRGFGEKS